MNSEDWAMARIFAGILAVVLLISLGVAWFAASQEAASYRKFCDTPVTTWDAFWLDLRIDMCRR